MIDFHKDLVNSLKTILPTYYELFLSSDCKVPCISYMELDNASIANGNTKGVSRIQYQVKVWGNDLTIIQNNVIKIDEALRKLGWMRISSNELADNNSSMIQKILTYEATALESFKED